MLDAPAAPKSAAQTRLRPTEEGIGDQLDEKNIKGQQPAVIGIGAPSQASNATQRNATQARLAPRAANVDMRMEDTMDRPNDPGG
eukprot:7290871-Heterocapsa_arctica.AAC.1